MFKYKGEETARHRKLEIFYRRKVVEKLGGNGVFK